MKMMVQLAFAVIFVLFRTTEFFLFFHFPDEINKLEMPEIADLLFFSL